MRTQVPTPVKIKLPPGDSQPSKDELEEETVASTGVKPYIVPFYYYTILRVCSIGHEGEGLKEIIEDARIEAATTSRPFSRGSTSWAASFPEISVRSLTLPAAPMPICPTAL